mmetsp:Transcript_28985/g.49383  ORF Transcript_28985/g.49383 Transcript_28985/m.49383 type:complete len:103 (-) Transcript_28985:130-438(-)
MGLNEAPLELLFLSSAAVGDTSPSWEHGVISESSKEELSIVSIAVPGVVGEIIALGAVGFNCWEENLIGENAELEEPIRNKLLGSFFDDLRETNRDGGRGSE